MTYITQSDYTHLLIDLISHFVLVAYFSSFVKDILANVLTQNWFSSPARLPDMRGSVTEIDTPIEQTHYFKQVKLLQWFNPTSSLST